MLRIYGLVPSPFYEQHHTLGNNGPQSVSDGKERSGIELCGGGGPIITVTASSPVGDRHLGEQQINAQLNGMDSWTRINVPSLGRFSHTAIIY